MGRLDSLDSKQLTNMYYMMDAALTFKTRIPSLACPGQHKVARENANASRAENTRAKRRTWMRTNILTKLENILRWGLENFSGKRAAFYRDCVEP